MTMIRDSDPAAGPTNGSQPPALPSRRAVRARLAVGIAVATLVASGFVAVAATAFAAWQDSDAGLPQVGVAQVDGEVVVIVTDNASEAADARNATLRWSLIALGLSVVPAIGVGWWIAGRMLSTVDAALTEVERAEQDRSRRLQEVIHELRTPLAVMGTNLELAASGPAVDTESSEFITAALRALDRMDRTVDDLAGHGGLTIEDTDEAADLAMVAGTVTGEFIGPARNRGIHVVQRGDGPVSAPSAGTAPLRTVLGNLMANAVRLAPSGSSIFVDWGSHGDWVWVSVSDEGPGIPGNDHARVFERGWRGPHERHRDEGAGLGLTIARQLTEAQGGRLTISSTEGTGSTFAVWLPTAPDADTNAAVRPDGIHPVTTPWERHSASARQPAGATTESTAS